MTNTPPIQETSPAVQSHLTILQTVIQRMASNSSSSKTWCVTLVSAILVIIADKGKPQYALIAAIPVVLFLILDAYYLTLERGFRKSYNSFIQKLHHQELKIDDLFVVVPEGNQYKIFLFSLVSFSIWPFYITLFAMILITKHLVI
jgi:mannose/fructose/N-acetylgalactosamine-specific phosphotransferase system component IIC